ncbi:hypothetical protein [uncultured Tateyamaria sp.]|uniref:hypothetical protein n=1 Tax=uncultured Tateyamaria sp. TaxID=455651 RepID=UPI0026388573|nr:hypothetical protein [uncultured Tateyamaria sp.]
MRIWIMMMALVLSGPVAALAVAPEPEEGLALVIVAPWQDPAPILAAMEGHEIGPVRAPMAFLVQSSDPEGHAKAYAAGAIWVTNSAVLATICGVAL